MNLNSEAIKELQEKVWQGSIALHVSLSPAECRTYDDSLPYLVQFPRLSYLPSLLPQVHKFFASLLIDPGVLPNQGWFSFQGVPLKWQQPVGLLYDVFSGSEPINHLDSEPRRNKTNDSSNDQDSTSVVLPWKLIVHFTNWPSDLLIPLDADGRVYHDSFMNSVKEADFLRNGTAKLIMSLSKDDSTRLWEAVQRHELVIYNSINHKFLNQPDGAPLRHIPIKIYLPNATPSFQETAKAEMINGTLKVVQALVTPMLSPKEPQTLGTTLHSILPTLFPSRRSYIFAHAVLHGVVVPMSAPVEQLMRGAAYADGFLHVSVVMIS